MKKHKIECPHCRKMFEFIAPVKKREPKPEESTTVFNECKTFWLEEFHKGWAFDGAEASALKKILDKIKSAIENGGKIVYSEQQHAMFFKYFCYHLPEYYQKKDLKVLNSKYNELIEQMKSGKTPQANGYNKKNSSERYSEAANRYR
jgi:hypothetical protein